MLLYRVEFVSNKLQYDRYKRESNFKLIFLSIFIKLKLFLFTRQSANN